VPFRKQDITATEADLVPIGKNLVKRLPKGWVSHEVFYAMLMHYGANHKPKPFKPGWASMKFKKKVGVWPERHWLNMASVPPDARVKNWIISRNIAYAKAREANHG